MLAVGIGLILTMSDGVPFTPTWGRFRSGNTLSNDDWPSRTGLAAPDANAYKPRKPNNYIKTQCFSVPLHRRGLLERELRSCTPSLGDPLIPLRSSASTFVQCRPNIIVGPGIKSVDFSVFKNNRIKRISENSTCSSSRDVQHYEPS